MTRMGLRTVVFVLIAFAASLAVTWTARSQRSEPAPAAASPVAEWLDLDPQQEKAIVERDAGFAEDLTRLRTELDEQQTRLAVIFEDASISDEMLLAQIESVIQAHNRLERRVADHLIAVRDRLTPDQQKKLFGLCAETVRQQREQQQMRWRHGQRRGGPSALPDDASKDAGSGPPYGRRHGRGAGRP